jgi:Family of unknown function (DUF6493)
MTELKEQRVARLKTLLRPFQHDSPETYHARRNAAFQEIVAHFSTMSEAERRQLAPEIVRLHKLALTQGFVAEDAPDDRLDQWHTSIALAATATLAELQRSGRWWFSAAACEALAARRPSWLIEAMELGFEQIRSCFIIGDIAHGIDRLVADGILPTPQHAHYAIGIAYGYVFPNDRRPFIDRVRTDLPRIEPAIWRQFEVEGDGEISLAHFDKYIAQKSGGRWAEVLVGLASEGRLDRQRLLDASLDAVNLGFAQFRAGWFSRFHESLAPTPDERAARKERYLALLASPLGPTVSFALAALKSLQKAGKLDAGAVLVHIEPAVFAKTAATAKGALGLLAHATRSAPKLHSEIARIAAIGLEHPSSEVQAAALDLLEICAAAMGGGTRDAIAQRIDVVSPSLRSRAAALLGSAVAMPATSARPGPEPGEIAELKARAKHLPRQLRQLAGLDAAFDAFARGLGDIPRAVFTGMDIPRLDPANAMAAIATLEELIDEALVAIEHPHDLDRVERVLAGALGFAAERPANAAELLAPLARSLKAYRARDHDGSDAKAPRGALQILMCALLGDTPSGFRVAEGDPRAIMVLRTGAMADAICSRTACVQLSAPTHRGFWIDPRVLVARSKDAVRRGLPLLGIADQILALLRLVPDHRPAALKAAQDLDGEWGAALRYALGGTAAKGKTRSLWVAASRARAPFDQDMQLAKSFGAGVRGADLPPLLTPQVSYRSYGSAKLYAVVAVAAEGREGDDTGDERSGQRSGRLAKPENCLTTVDLAEPPRLKTLRAYDTHDGFRAGSWAPALWPQHPEPLFAVAALAACMIDGNDYERPGNVPLADGLKLILEPDVPIGPMAMFMLCRGLNAIDAAAAQATVDALIATIDDGRLDGDTLGQAMHAFLSTGLVFGRRWPDRLKEVARASPLGRQVVRRALERAMHPATPQSKLRDVHAWIETLHDLSIEAGAAVEDPLTREGLAQFLKAGKARKPAQALLDLASAQSEAHRSAAAAHAMRRRLARAERWATMTKQPTKTRVHFRP